MKTYLVIFMKIMVYFLTSGKDYGLGGSGFLRWNIATPTTILQEGLERLRLGVAALNDCYSNSDNI